MKQLCTEIRHIIAICLVALLPLCAQAQQTVEQAAKDKTSFALAINDIDYNLVHKNEEKAQGAFNNAMGYIDAHLKTLDAKMTAATTEAQKIMYTEKITAAQKQKEELVELSKKMPENRTVINLKLREVLQSM
jgi:hypothetical protein